MGEEERAVLARRKVLRRQTRDHVAHALELDLLGGEAIMKEVWESCATTDDIAVVKQELRDIIKVLRR